MNQLIVRELTKTYDNGVRALDSVSLEISKGMFGLLGPNGAGKSTLMRTIATLQEPDAGSIKLGDVDVLKEKKRVRRNLGYLPQEFGLYPRLSATYLLDHLATLKGIAGKKVRRELVEALLYKVNLYEDRHKRLGGFSGGMKQRFGIAQALLSNPALLIVDEPTAGLDPVERNRFYNLLSEVGEDAIVILSTHIVSDVKELCTKMAIINKGKIMLQGNPQSLIEGLQGKIYRKTVLKSVLPAYYKSYQVIADFLYLGKPTIHVYSDDHPQQGFTEVDASLEDVYFSKISSELPVSKSVAL